MLTDLNKSTLTTSKFRGFDVAVIGAGAAGITIAIKLASNGKKVALIEAGGQEYSEVSQEVYRAKTMGDPYFDLDVARLRYFGGTTNHWGGWCRTFEPEDFNRGYLGKEYEWPIKLSELNKYLVEACKILEISDEFNDNRLNGNSIESIDFNFSPPVRFGSKYYKSLITNPNVHVFLNSNLVDVTHSDNNITAVKVASYNEKFSFINADNFVFAMGGIENSRYLLWLQKVYGSSFISEFLPIGKYWMEHPHFTLGKAIVNKSKVRERFYTLNSEVQTNYKIMNCGFRVEHLNTHDTKALIRDILCLAPKLGKNLAALAGKNLVCGALFRAAWEQSPNNRNHIGLDIDKDQFGIPKPILNWKKTELDRKTLIRSVAEFNDWLLKLDAGRIQLDEWVLNGKDYPLNDELAGYHHMGGTRMHKNKKLGVVDEHCKVYGSKNLYMAGSSIFTTGGHNNPTLPIIQFSLRLSEYLCS